MPEILIINFGKGVSHTGSRSTTAVMEFSDDSDLSDRSKTRLKALLGRAKEMERYRRDSEEWRESFW